MTEARIIGLGVHPFGRHSLSGADQGVVAINEALKDAGLQWTDIQFAYGGSMQAGHPDTIIPKLGPLTGIHFANAVNGCATGGSALSSATFAIKSGDYDLGLVVGFDKHPRGAFAAKPEDNDLPAWYGETGMMLTTQFFAMKIMRYMDQFGISETTLAKIAAKAFRNASKTPHAWRRQPLSVEEILASPMVNDPLRKYMFCNPAEGAVALIVASDKRARELGRDGVRIRSVAMRSRPPGSFEVWAPSLDVERGGSATEIASRAAYDLAGAGPEDIDVCQLQDTESGAEVMHLAENSFCRDGEQEAWVRDGATEIGGRLPVNTDGGCLGCGEPIGASGLRQIYETSLQLLGRADGRQVENARLGYTQVYGSPGVSAVAVLERAA